MSTKIKELREKKGEVVHVIEGLRDTLHDKPDDWTGDHERRWDEANKDLERLNRLIDFEETLEREHRRSERRSEIPEIPDERGEHRRDDDEDDEDRRLVRSTVDAETRMVALQAWMLANCKEPQPLSKRHREALHKVGSMASAPSFEIPLERRSYHEIRSRVARELRADTVDNTGGEFVRDEFSGRLERALLAFGGVRQVAEVLRTATGAALSWPTIDDTSNVGQIEGEGDAIATQDIATSELVLNAYKYSSDAVLVSAELLQDSAFNLAGLLGDILGERLGRKTNADFTTGSGTGAPKGIVTASTAGKTAAATNAITADEIIDLYHSVDPAYRGSAAFMLHDSIVAIIRKLKDSTNQYLWQPGMQAGVPDRLLGHPVVVNQSMASSLSASTKAILFGDLSKYKVREVGSIRLRRLVERYADTDREAFIAFWRGDGDLLNAGTNPVKHLITAAS